MKIKIPFKFRNKKPLEGSYKLFYDYMMAPPFGMAMDPDKIITANIKNGGEGTPYPHFYINFCN